MTPRFKPALALEEVRVARSVSATTGISAFALRIVPCGVHVVPRASDLHHVPGMVHGVYQQRGVLHTSTVEHVRQSKRVRLANAEPFHHTSVSGERARIRIAVLASSISSIEVVSSPIAKPVVQRIGLRHVVHGIVHAGKRSAYSLFVVRFHGLILGRCSGEVGGPHGHYHASGRVIAHRQRRAHVESVWVLEYSVNVILEKASERVVVGNNISK